MDAITDTDLAYAAGVIDSDGSISLARPAYPGSPRGVRFAPRVRVTNSDRNMLHWFRERWDGHVYQRHQVGWAGPKTSASYTWDLCGQEAAIFAWQIAEFLIRKKAQAELLASYWTDATWTQWDGSGSRGMPDPEFERRDRIFFRLKELNARIYT